MKKLYTASLFLLLSFTFCKAQFVTIPDADFVSYLQANYPACMNGNQMDTTCSDIINATSVNISYSNVADLTGIQYFDKLQSLSVDNTKLATLPALPVTLTSLDLTHCKLSSLPDLPPLLTEFICRWNELTSLPVLPGSLFTFDCGYNQLTVLPDLPPNLTYLNFDFNQVTSVNYLPDGIMEIDCLDNQLTTFPQLPGSLQYMECIGNKLTSLPDLPYGLVELEVDSNLLSTIPPAPATLQTLYCGYNHITALPDLSSSSLLVLSCGYNQLTSLPALPNGLQELDCQYNQLTGLPSLPSSIESFECFNNQIATLPALPTELKELDCSYNLITGLPALPATLTSFTYFICSNNLLTTLPPIQAALKNFDCSYNQLTSLSSLPNTLSTLNCSDNQLISLPTLPDSLTALDCDDNQLAALPALPSALTSLVCFYNNLTSLPDLPPVLANFDVSNNPSLNCMPPLKKFIGNDFYIGLTGITCLPNYIQHSGYIAAIDNMPVCGLFNSNGCSVAWNIEGNIFKDDNLNCQKDSAETNIYNVKMKLYQGSNLVQSGYFSGNYSFKTALSTYKVTVDTSGFPFYVSCPAGGDSTLNITAPDSLKYNVNFGIHCKPGFDIGVWDVHAFQRFFPNETTNVYISAGDLMRAKFGATCNLSGLNGKVTVQISGPATYNAPLAGALTPSISGNLLTYNIADFAQVNASTDFNFSVITNTAVKIGDAVCFDVTVTPTAGDNNLSNNTLSHCFQISNSFDPNEKEVSPPGSLPPGYTDWLTYTIHFQNTGNAAAKHIQVLDTLDAHLNAETFQLLSSSFTPTIQITGNDVAFDFININLPDSLSDKAGSMGYVEYRIKPFANQSAGSGIANTASIYFDFNAPVVTNTVHNNFCNPDTTRIIGGLCEGKGSYYFNGVYETSPGVYDTTLTASGGCDSVVILTLVILDPIAITQLYDTLCPGNAVFFNDTIRNASGNYSVTYLSINGCDSVVTLNLIVQPINPIFIYQAGDTLTVFNNNGATIKWLNCDTRIVIRGINDSAFVAAAGGNFAAIISSGVCTDTTVCFPIIITGAGTMPEADNIKVYPNPVDRELLVNSYSLLVNEIEVRDLLGRTIIVQLVPAQTKQTAIDVSNLTAGVYFITVHTEGGSVVRKFVKQ